MKRQRILIALSVLILASAALAIGSRAQLASRAFAFTKSSTIPIARQTISRT